jgi:hypothetical protein
MWSGQKQALKKSIGTHINMEMKLIAFSIWMEKVANLMPRPLLTWGKAPITKWREGWLDWTLSGEIPSSAQNWMLDHLAHSLVTILNTLYGLFVFYHTVSTPTAFSATQKINFCHPAHHYVNSKSKRSITSGINFTKSTCHSWLHVCTAGGYSWDLCLIFFHIMEDLCWGVGVEAPLGTCSYFVDVLRWPCIVCVHFTQYSDK